MLSLTESYRKRGVRVLLVRHSPSHLVKLVDLSGLKVTAPYTITIPPRLHPLRASMHRSCVCV